MWDVTSIGNDGFLRSVNFYSHIPCGMWHLSGLYCSGGRNFYSHIPCGMWHKKQEKGLNTLKFLLTHPVWDVTQYSRCCGHWERFLLTHPVWDVTEYGCAYGTIILISTHTSRVGCDLYSQFVLALLHISTHTSRVGCDKIYRMSIWAYMISTHTSRVGCDALLIAYIHRADYFYSHIPCGMWPLYIVYYSLSIPIYHEMDL